LLEEENCKYRVEDKGLVHGWCILD